MRSVDRVVVTGVGVLSPLGTCKAAHWEGVVNGRSGVRTIDRFRVDDLRTRFAGLLPAFEPGPFLSEREQAQTDPFAQMAVVAAVEALEDAGLRPREDDPRRFGLVLGTSQGGRVADEEVMGLFFKSEGRRTRALAVPLVMPAAACSWVALKTGIGGPTHTLSNACASGLSSIGLALTILRSDASLDAVLAGGSDAPVTRSMLVAWTSARATSCRNEEPETASRPFDADRDGLVIAEGAAVLVLERLDRARSRSVPIYAEVLGFGATNDAFDLTRPEPTGVAAAGAMRAALADAGVAPEDVEWVSAHGTSTPLNDAAETAALKQAFGQHSRRLAVSALKSMIGHAMGAAGAIEAVTAALALRHSLIPPTINYRTPDPECDLDYVPNQARRALGGHVLLESFAFGGANAALVMRPWPS